MIKELKDAVNWHKDKDYFMSTELREDRQDSNWYDGLLYSFKYKGHEFSVYAHGDIRIDYKGEIYHNIYDTDLKNDKDLQRALEKNELTWENNNWYELFVDKIDENGEQIEEIDSFVIDYITDCLDKEWVEDLVKGE